MSRVIISGVVGATLLAMGMGCQGPDTTPPPPRASIPPVGTYTEPRGELPKPLPDPQRPDYQPPFADEPIVTQAPPEQPAYVDAYGRVGSPRISLFVNRSLEGQIIPTNPGRRVGGVEVTREATGPIKIEERRERVDPWGRPIDQQVERFESTGPAKLTDRAEVYLAAGEYDEVSARRIDYEAVENIMTDWLAGGGKVTMVSPRLTEAQTKELQQGRRNILNELSKDNQIDVLIQVQAKATRQTPRGLEVRLIAEAINTQGGESIGRAVVDLPPPLEKTTINEYTRFLARKLMSDMTRTWSNPRPAPAQPGSGPTDANMPQPQGQPPVQTPMPMPAPSPSPSPAPTTGPAAGAEPEPAPRALPKPIFKSLPEPFDPQPNDR